MPRRKMRSQTRKICVEEEVRISIHRCIERFLEDDKSEYEFPSSFTNTQRAYIHQICPQLGLSSKSKGKSPNRRIVVRKTKKGDSTHDIASVFSFGQNSSRVLQSLLHRWPVKLKERMDLQPRSAKQHIGTSQETLSFRPDASKTSGRLNNGIPQVPVQRLKSDLDAFRATLPVASMAKELISAIDEHPVILICGETGSGKTTQIPQFILDDCANNGDKRCRIICTQPRRISTVSMAERVAAERGENVGHTVGYQIRLESRVSPRTLLTFCTNGVLLRTLMAGDSSLSTVTHVIVDEVHERDRFCDFLLIKLRQLAHSRSSPRHPKFKLILMSAAMDVDLFVRYFNNCPIIHIPGKMYDVKQYYLEHVLQMTGRFGKGVSTLKEWGQIEEKKKAKTQPLENDISTSSKKPSSTVLIDNCDSWRIEAMDSALYALWQSASVACDETDDSEGISDPFPQIFHLIQSENIPVDYRHSETGVTALMASAMYGAIEECEKLVMLGADTTLKAANDWTAADMAYNFGHDDLAEILSNISLDEIEHACDAPKDNVLANVAQMSEEDREIVSNYQKGFDDSRVDTDLIIDLLLLLTKEKDQGAILVFLPGYDDIVTLREKILSDDYSVELGNVKLYILHSGMQSSSDQKQVFRPAPTGFRKIILSTNIAETSVTIEDVVYVIDSGKVKLKIFEAVTSTSTLKSVWISKSSAMQRKGRAGRCRPGTCFHLFSSARFNAMSHFQPAEILRTPLHELCLQAKLLSVAPKKRRSKGETSENTEARSESCESIVEFLSNAPEAPSKIMLDNAVNLLKTIDALDPWEDLTELGHHLVDLPIEPRLGKMVLYSVVLKCLDPVLTIACTLAYKDPFLLPHAPEEKKQAFICRVKYAAGTFSDHMCLLRAFQAWQKAKSDGWERAFCNKNYLSPATMQMIIGMRTQLLGQLRAAGFVRARGGSDIRDLNSNSENWAVVKAAICASAYPNVLKFNPDNKKLASRQHKKVRFHQSSILCKEQSGKRNQAAALKALPTNWLVYDELTMPAKHFSGLALAQCCTAVTPACIALFSGPAYLVQADAISEPPSQQYASNSCDSDSEDELKPTERLSTLMITDWIKLKLDLQLAETMIDLRTKWYSLFLRRIRSPAKPWLPEDEAVLSSIINILSSEDQSHNLLQPSGIGQRPRPMSQEDGQKGFTGLKVKTPKKKNPEPYKQSSKMRSSTPLDGAHGRPQSGRLSATFSTGDDSAEPSPRMGDSVSLLEGFNAEPKIEPSVQITVLSVMCKSEKNIHISQRNGVWLVCKEEEELLHSAFESSIKVLLVVFLGDMRYPQGYARLTSPGTQFANALESQNFGWDKDEKQSKKDLTAYFSLEWLSKIPIAIDLPWTENHDKTIWKVDPDVGLSVVEKFSSDSQTATPVGINPNSQPFYPSQYARPGIPNQPNILTQYQHGMMHPAVQQRLPYMGQFYNQFQYRANLQSMYHQNAMLQNLPSSSTSTDFLDQRN